jgi:hypothetical protein
MPTGERTRYYQTRPRRVPPEFCTDELLEGCSVLATLLLYRLISLADDQGRLPGHPKHVKGTAFPMRPDVTERRVAAALDEIVRAGFAIRYDFKGRVLLQIDRWFDLQGKWSQRRTYPSQYPAPPGWTEDWVTAGTDDEVRALGTPGARDVRPPFPLPSAPSSTVPFTGQGETSSQGGGPERIGHLLDRAKRGQLTDDEALELGAMVAADEQSTERVPR